MQHFIINSGAAYADYSFLGMTSTSVVTYRIDGPAYRDIEPAEVAFPRLAHQWRTETATFSSDFMDIVTSPAYMRIISLGWPAVPLILREMEREPDHWGAALEAITGESPVPPDAAGDIDAIAQAWIAWGRTHGLLA